MKSNYRFVFIFAILAGTLLGFQNCGDAEFSSALSQNSNGSLDDEWDGDGDDRDPEDEGVDLRETFRVSTQTNFNKVDVLFVLDESVSMSTIITNVRSGFTALAAAAYPSDTLMAVTNMSPAYYTSPSQFNPLQSYVGESYVAAQPGFLRLVNKASLSSFGVGNPARSWEIVRQGCVQSWFTPTAKDAQNYPCLVGATQIALQPVGVEAGLVSLSQLAERTMGSGQRLFREGALVNIIFVSDTHDSGQADSVSGADLYYGKPGAPAQIATPAALTSKLHALNPNLAGIRFNAIAPLPPAGDPRAAGLRVIGTLPATIADSRINGEHLHDFSYLPFVRASGGVAMHAARSNWVDAISSMVGDLTKRVNAVVSLSRTASRIISVKVNGTVLAANEYSLHSGNKIEIITRPSWPAQIDIVVDYVPL